MDEAPSSFELKTAGGTRTLAYRQISGSSPTVVWLGGFMSDMKGTKAEALAAWARATGRSFLRFDYSCHGESHGDIMEGCISRWTEEAQAIIATLAPGEKVLVGSSMGGWIALRIARAMLDAGTPLKAMVLIAPAPDFTDKLMWPSLPQEAKAEIMEKGHWRRPSAYDAGGYVISRRLIEDGKTCSVLDSEVRTGCRVHILQGMRDEDVPYAHALRLMAALAQDDATMTLVKDGDHRLSRPQDIAKLIEAVENAIQP